MYSNFIQKWLQTQLENKDLLALCLVLIKYLINEWKRNVIFPFLFVAKACKTIVKFPWMDVVTSTVKPLKNDKFFPLCGQCFHLFCFWMFYFALVKIWLLRRVQVTLKIFRAILLRFSLFFLLPDKIYYRWRVLAWVLKIGQISWDVSPAILRAQAVAECLMEK